MPADLTRTRYYAHAERLCFRCHSNDAHRDGCAECGGRGWLDGGTVPLGEALEGIGGVIVSPEAALALSASLEALVRGDVVARLEALEASLRVARGESQT